MSEYLRKMKEEVEAIHNYEESETAWANYQRALNETIFPALDQVAPEDAIDTITEWLKVHASAALARNLYDMVQATKIYLPVIMAISEFDVEPDEVDDDEWMSVVEEAEERLVEHDLLRNMRLQAYESIEAVLNERKPEWYLG